MTPVKHKPVTSCSQVEETSYKQINIKNSFFAIHSISVSGLSKVRINTPISVNIVHILRFEVYCQWNYDTSNYVKSKRKNILKYSEPSQLATYVSIF